MPSSRITFITAAFSFLFAVLLGLLFFGPKSEKNTDNTFRMTLSNEPPTLDWNLATDSVSFAVLINLMEGLTEYDDALNPKPAVARSWDVSEDGLTYTFHLRKDVLWSDGVPVTAHDFEYSWKRLLKPETAAEYAYFLYDIEGAFDFNTGKNPDPASVGVHAADDSTLVVRLNKPIVFFPSITTFMVTYPMREDIVSKHGDLWTEPGRMVTNGPFTLDRWHHEYKLTLGRNPKFYGTPPALEKVELYVVNERTTALTLFETGDIEITELPPEAIAPYKKKPEYRTAPLLRGYYYGFNIYQPPFSDPLVRRAFSLAIDRAEFPIILKGGEIPAAYWIPPGMPYHNPDIGLSFDPERARNLLAEAGFPDGKGFPSVTAVFNTGPVHRLVAENLQAQWKRNLGVKVELDNQEWKVYLSRLQSDTPALFRLGWGADYPDPDNFMNLFTSTSGNNRSKWKNSEFDLLIQSAAAEPDPEKRQKAYNRSQKILLEEEAAIIPLFVAVQNWAVSPRVKGLKLNPLEMLFLKHIRLECPEC